MTSDRPTPRPPEWAESLLRIMLKPGDRESVSGDLLQMLLGYRLIVKRHQRDLMPAAQRAELVKDAHGVALDRRRGKARRHEADLHGDSLAKRTRNWRRPE